MGLTTLDYPSAKLTSEVVTAGLTRVQCPNNPNARWVQFMHEHATAKVYFGGDDVTVANGFGSLGNKDTTERYPIQNTDIFYLISDTAGVSVRLLWGE